MSKPKGPRKKILPSSSINISDPINHQPKQKSLKQDDIKNTSEQIFINPPSYSKKEKAAKF